jgi:hypothetical protein
MLAWLRSIRGRVINPPLPFALGGGTFAPARLIHAAAMAGLPTRPWRASTPDASGTIDTPPRTTHATLVVDGDVYGAPVPDDLREACLRMASLLGVPLLQILFHRSPEVGWQFVDASGHADYRLGGSALAAALARAFPAE